MTRRDAEKLIGALLRQLASRHVAMRDEANAAVGLPVSKKFVTPPDWVLCAIRVAFFGRRDIKLPAAPPTANDFFSMLGGFVGMARTWEAYLSKPPGEQAKLEARFPFAASARMEIKKITASASAPIHRFEAKMRKADISPASRRAFLSGQAQAAADIVDETGELKEATDVRTDIAYLIWLFWPELRRLGSITELEKLLREFRQDDVSKKNLEKVCREIGLRFRGRGRPKNLLHRSHA